MPLNVSVFFTDPGLKAILAFINCEGSPFAMSDEMLKENESILDNIKNITSSGLQGEIPQDFKWLLGDLEIGILKSSIEIQAKVHKLLNLCSSVREAVDDNTRPLKEFLEDINLPKYAEALASAFEDLTVEDFTNKESLTKLESHITSKIHYKKVVREIKKCEAKKDDLDKIIKEMRETLVEISEILKKIEKKIPDIKEKIRQAIQSKEDVKAKCEKDKNYEWCKRFEYGSLCVVGAVATLVLGMGAVAAVGAAASAGSAVAGAAAAVGATASAGSAVAGAAAAVGATASAGGFVAGTVAAVGATAPAGGFVAGAAAAVVGAGTAVAGYNAYQYHKKTSKLSDDLEQLEKTLMAMNNALSYTVKRETDLMERVHAPIQQAETDQEQLGKRVSKLPSSKKDKKRFQDDLKCSEETLQRWDVGMTFLKESANAVLDVLHG